jgi:sarcosine oxidase subunit alpha
LKISAGLEVRAQNVTGSLRLDIRAGTALLSRFLRPGFYYRAFFRPQGIWPFWERIFRRAAGLGKISRSTRHTPTDKQYLFADVAVLGAGPAGLGAAIAAGRAGASVVLVDEAAYAGGSLGYAGFQRDRQQNAALLQTLLGEVAALPNVRPGGGGNRQHRAAHGIPE